jgi:vacuole morphology and inheritance protein 14
MQFANQLSQVQDLEFVQDLIETLTFTLSVSPLYRTLRHKLQGKAETAAVKTKEMLFLKLFTTWSFCPVSTLHLCLLARNYELAYNLIPRFTSLEMTTGRLILFGNLVQLIESPSFARKLFSNHHTYIDLRIELMRQDKNQKYLVKTLQGILMILPISKTFQALKTRLECISLGQVDLP